MLERFRLTNGALLLAESQTAGRGRAGRNWVSPPDVNLYFTIILTPTAEDAHCLFYVAPLAVAHAVEEAAAAKGGRLRADLKWPNDILLEGRKVAGILIETTSLGDGRLVALVGIGINVNLDVAAYPEIEGIATSLKEVLGFPVSREELLAAVCNHLESLYESARQGSQIPFSEWRGRLINLGRPVVANGAHERVEGIAVDVAADGALIIERAGGERVVVEAGDVTLSHATPD
jgi:BirA family biotin operon repressor/biotin-[acetyl-CoA-carboxylase] ligase